MRARNQHGAEAAAPAHSHPPDVKAPRAAGGGKGRGVVQSKTSGADCQPLSGERQLAELLPIQPERIGSDQGAVLVSALHRALGIRKDFTNWAKHQFRRAMLVQGADFEVYAQKGENSKYGRPGADWLVTLDGAKHIALMSATPRGAQVRRYFIEAERALLRQNVVAYAQASVVLGRLLLARQRLEAEGSRAGRVLGTLRRMRDINDHDRQMQLELIDSFLPVSEAMQALGGRE